jgi:hypothetical protein
MVAPLSREVRARLWSLTAGHIGIVCAALELIGKKFKDQNAWKQTSPQRAQTKIEIQRWLCAPSTINLLQCEIRSFGCVDTLCTALDQKRPPRYFDALCEAVKYSSPSGALPAEWAANNLEACKSMFRSGFLSPVNGAVDLYSFVAPVLVTALVNRLGRRATVAPASVHDLVRRALRAMRQSVLNAIPHDKHNESTFSKV